MSHYGSPGEPPGQRPGPYGPPADPWGERPTEPWAADVTRSTGYQPPVGADDGPPVAGPYPAGPTAGREAEPGLPPGYGLLDEPSRRPIGLYVAVAVIVVLAAVGVGYALYLLSDDDPEPPVARPTATTTPTPSPAPSGEVVRENIGMNAAMALVNDCLVNDGTEDEPQMRIVPCDSEEETELYQVLEIFNERVEGTKEEADQQAQRICADTEGYTHHYYEVGQTASFVLCMAEKG